MADEKQQIDLIEAILIGCLILMFIPALLTLTSTENDSTSYTNDIISQNFTSTQVTHFCIEQGYDRGYYSSYFDEITCSNDYSNQEFYNWKNQEVGS